MNYISKTIDLIRSQEFYGTSESIEIAKGKYQIVDSWSVFIRKLKRSIHGNRKRN